MAKERMLPYTADEVADRLGKVPDKLDKNLGAENSGKVAGINSSGEIVPMFAPGFKYNEVDQCIEYVDTELDLDDSIKLDNTLTRSGYATDSKVTGDKINKLMKIL